MKFGVREVMVVAALAFGIVAAGCTTSFRTNLAMEPHLRAMNASASDYRICFSEYEFEFYYPEVEPTLREYSPEVVEVAESASDGVDMADAVSAAIAGGAAAGMPEYGGADRSWSSSLPTFLK